MSGILITIRWAHDGIVTSGPYCTVQGVITGRQTGSKARGFAGVMILVGLTSIFSTLWVAIGTGIHQNYDTPDPVRNFDPLPRSHPSDLF